VHNPAGVSHTVAIGAKFCDHNSAEASHTVAIGAQFCAHSGFWMFENAVEPDEEETPIRPQNLVEIWAILLE